MSRINIRLWRRDKLVYLCRSLESIAELSELNVN